MVAVPSMKPRLTVLNSWRAFAAAVSAGAGVISELMVCGKLDLGLASVDTEWGRLESGACAEICDIKQYGITTLWSSSQDTIAPAR